MATLSDIRTKVLAKLVEAGGTTASPTASQVDDEINAVIDFYEPMAFWFNQGSTSGATMTASTATLALPNDFSIFFEPNSLVIQDGSFRYEVEKITPQEYDVLFSSGTTGRPYFYIVRNNQIELYPTPDENYSYTLYYFKAYADLVDDADTNDFTLYAPRLVENRAIAECYINYRSDPEMAAQFVAKANEEEKRLVSQTAQRVATGKIQADSLVDMPVLRGWIYST